MFRTFRLRVQGVLGLQVKDSECFVDLMFKV